MSDISHENILLKDLVEKLRECSNILKNFLKEEFLGMILFGSWARGEAKVDSDIDLFILLRSLKGFEARSEIYKVLARCIKRPVTLIDVRFDELFRESINLTPLLLNILYDGVVIYDETGLLTKLVAKTREFVRSTGLVRYKTKDGKYGWERSDKKPLEVVKWSLE
ncbi:MAG: nucleotidyltransferase domain-containing protein [Desulfurococcaceae archaeon]|nr:nucleotidyltransferase domain-containing protein [Desulfurococcaceae archaeon]